MQIGSLSSPQPAQSRPTRPGVARVSAVDAAGAAEAASPEARRLAERALPAAPLARRPQPATMLEAMFEQMGGTATSVWKGMYVNTVI